MGFIIYPGLFVDLRSYALAAHAIAAQGYLSYGKDEGCDTAVGATDIAAPGRLWKKHLL